MDYIFSGDAGALFQLLFFLLFIFRYLRTVVSVFTFICYRFYRDEDVRLVGQW